MGRLGVVRGAAAGGYIARERGDPMRHLTGRYSSSWAAKFEIGAFISKVREARCWRALKRRLLGGALGIPEPSQPGRLERRRERHLTGAFSARERSVSRKNHENHRSESRAPDTPQLASTVAAAAENVRKTSRTSPLLMLTGG